MIRVKAYAKINLILDILGKLETGYHEVWMVMQSVSLYDEITAEKNVNRKIILTCSEKSLPTNSKNIAYAAAELFLSETNIKHGVTIHIDKNIPLSAGLAGGSADAAGVLTALNELFATKLPMKKLAQMGAKLGADVPFCLQGGTMIAQYTGIILSQLPDIPPCFIVLAKPKGGVSTKEAYEAASKQKLHHTSNDDMFKAIMCGDLQEFAKNVGNVFEQVILIQERVEIKEIMRDCGALSSCMTGTGSTIFGIFDSKEKATACKEKLSETIRDVFVTVPKGFGQEIQ